MTSTRHSDPSAAARGPSVGRDSLIDFRRQELDAELGKRRPFRDWLAIASLSLALALFVSGRSLAGALRSDPSGISQCIAVVFAIAFGKSLRDAYSSAARDQAFFAAASRTSRRSSGATTGSSRISGSNCCTHGCERAGQRRRAGPRDAERGRRPERADGRHQRDAGRHGPRVRRDADGLDLLIGSIFGGVILRLIYTSVNGQVEHLVAHVAEITEVHILPVLRDAGRERRLVESGATPTRKPRVDTPRSAAAPARPAVAAVPATRDDDDDDDDEDPIVIDAMRGGGGADEVIGGGRAIA